MNRQIDIEKKALSEYKNLQDWQAEYKDKIDTLIEFVGRRGDKFSLSTEELQILFKAYNWYMRDAPNVSQNDIEDIGYWLIDEYMDCEEELENRGFLLPHNL